VIFNCRTVLGACHLWPCGIPNDWLTRMTSKTKGRVDKGIAFKVCNIDSSIKKKK